MIDIEYYTLIKNSPRLSSVVGEVIAPNKSGVTPIYPVFYVRMESDVYYLYGAQNTNGGSPRQFIGGYGGYPTSYYQANDNSSIVFAVPKGKAVDNYLTSSPLVHKFEKKTLTGRYKFKSAFTNFNLPNYTTSIYNGVYTTILVPCNFEFEGENYNFIGGRANTRGTTTNADTFYFIKNDYTVVTLTSADMKNKVINFGDFANEIPDFVYNWITQNTDALYPYTYTVKDYLGNTILSSIVEAPPMVEASLISVENQKTLILTGVNGNDYELRWYSETPEGKQFLGLSTSPESNRPTLPTNATSSVSWVGDLVFYESYGKYRPPATTFDINLYQNSAEVNRVDKGQFLVGVGTLSGALREECSMLTPSIVYQSSDVPTFNYVYIPIFNRYYYVTSLSSVSKNVWRMELNCDVLMSYKEQIFLLQGVIGRQEIDFNPLLVDNELPTQNNPIVEVIDIPSDAFNTQATDAGHNYVITVIGA